MSNIETCNEIWNKIVKKFNENLTSEEYKLQNLWEKIFEQYLHYNSLDDEIITNKQVHLGSTDRLITDIILRKDSKDFAVIELKKENFTSTDKFRQQLFSYLRQLKISLGILITNKIEIFIYDSSKEDEKQQCVEIQFVANNVLGEQFVSLFEKNNIDINAIKEFVNKNCKVKDDYQEIASITNENLIKNLLLHYYQEKNYNDLAVKNYFNNNKIEIIQIEAKPNVSNNEYKASEHYHKQISFCSYNFDKNSATEFCLKNQVPLSRYITFTNCNSSGKFPANTNLSYLKEDWTIIMNDSYYKKMHILKIPANTFTYKDFLIRKDKKDLIVLGIDRNFVDFHPHENKENRFAKYKIKTINY